MKWILQSEPLANAVRYQPDRKGHVESFFWRVNDPDRPRALWLKATILAPQDGPPVAECWCVWFDGEKGRTFAHKETLPLTADTFAGEPSSLDVTIGANRFHVGFVGQAEGKLEGPRGAAEWQLRWRSESTPVATPLSIYPWRFLRQGPFPKSKLLTPFPFLRFSGTLDVFDETITLDGWPGMQGHNWGQSHAHEYVWGQCLFPGADGEAAMVEGFSGRVKLGSLVTPRMSALIVRRGPEVYRFDRIFDLWRQKASLDEWRWTLKLGGRDGQVWMTMDARGMPLVCLGYYNPDGHLSYCFNTKLAHVQLEVRPRRGRPFTLESDHGGALEFLRPTLHPDFPDVV
ncbi:MAG: hypothetical protein JW797_06115 [Bradymonadales bacterium]|nr:hypothetical protein [Bradymonadales bacterium]